MVPPPAPPGRRPRARTDAGILGADLMRTALALVAGTWAAPSPAEQSTRSADASHLMRHHRPLTSPGLVDDQVVLGFNRLLDHRHRPFAPAAALGARRTTPTGTSWSSTARSTTTSATHGRCGLEVRRGVRHRRRRREAIRPPTTTGHHGADPVARHVRVRAVGHRPPRAVLRPRPFGIKPLFMATGPAAPSAARRKCLLDLADPGRRHRIDVRALQHTVLQYVPNGDAAPRHPRLSRAAPR